MSVIAIQFPDGRQTGSYTEKGMVGRAETAARVKPVSPFHWFVIALHSPEANSETGLPMCPPEKSSEITQFAASGPFSSLFSPVCLRIVPKNGHLSRISRQA